MLLWNICIPYISSVRELQTDFRQKLWSPAKNTECKTKRLSHKFELPHVGFLYNEWTLYLTENINEPAIDSTSACNNAVTGELWEKKMIKIHWKCRKIRNTLLQEVFVHDLLPCFCPAPCRSRRNGVPQTCPFLQRIQGQAVVALAPWLSAYPGPHHNGKFITVMHQICHRSESLPATLQKLWFWNVWLL